MTVNAHQTTILGLDLGTNSVGWALLACDANNNLPNQLIATGSRIFQSPIEPKGDASKAVKRREKRQLRKQLARKRWRREKVQQWLIRHGWIDQEQIGNSATYNQLGCPYQLRAEAFNRQLSLTELARIMLNFSQRRGFKSNRKGADTNEDGVVKASISALKQDIEAQNLHTLGQFLAQQSQKGLRLRGQYTDRSMFEHEFDLIWAYQTTFYPDVLTQTAKDELFQALFFQRPLKSTKHLIGKCTFEANRPRAPRACLEFQEFRVWDDLNKLTYQNPITREWHPVSLADRQKLYDKLKIAKSMTWSAIRKTLGLHNGEAINMEESKKDGLMGLATSYTLHKVFKEHDADWLALGIGQQRRLVHDLCKYDDAAKLSHILTEGKWHFSPTLAQALMRATDQFNAGYASICVEVIHQILPIMRRGVPYHEACLQAGFHHSQVTTLGQQSLLDYKDIEAMHITNPVVKKGLYELRKVVNAIIKRYGKPSLIRLELARDTKLGKREKMELNQTNRKNEKSNQEAAHEIEARGGKATHEAKLRYRLWKESGGLCVYTGRNIGIEQLWTADVDIEHILPIGRSMDDSYMNKTLCFATENRQIKRNKTPYEAYAGDATRYQTILQRAAQLPYPKRKRFEQKTIDTDEFINRQLNDTRYICVQAKDYLRTLGIEVEVTKGKFTSVVRHCLGLNSLLNSKGNLKNREDHRHHAVDAMVIALMSRSLVMQLAREYDLDRQKFTLDEPWQGFYLDATEHIANVYASHAATHKITGAFHDETGWGLAPEENGFVLRKPLDENTSVRQIEQIRDETVKQLVQARLDAHQGDAKKAFGNLREYPLYHKDGKTPITRIRIVDSSKAKSTMFSKPLRSTVAKHMQPRHQYFMYGNNHHLEVFAHPITDKRYVRVVTMLEAAQRVRREKLPMVNRHYQPEAEAQAWQFVMSLCPNDIVSMTDGKTGEITFYRLQSISITEKSIQIIFQPINSTCTTYESGVSKKLTSEKAFLGVTKYQIDPLGQLSRAND